MTTELDLMTKLIKKVIYYGNESEQFGQLIKPKEIENITVPVVIVIHGGYWKDNHSLDSYATNAIVDYLTSFNVAIWNLEYRRMESSGRNNKAVWPSVFQDTANGIDFLATIARQECLDLTRVLIIGHSAGGSLAVWAGCRDNIPPTSILFKATALKITSVLSIAGILNLSCCNDVDQPEQVHRLMAGTNEQFSERYQACDPNLLHNPSLDLTIIHGKKDTAVQISQAQSYCDNAKGNIEKIFITQADHFSMLPHEGGWQMSHWKILQAAIVDKILALA